MFNNSQDASISNHVNAVTGAITKTYRQSYFKRFHLKSRLADTFFTSDSKTIVIQMVMCGEMDVIAELIDRKEYEKLFEKE
ncbi:hypothetical protein [Salipaludibacillus sp. CF4.18]|uniref:hypothetical protein n=1 Tax=Salipaludibacillus sp. CF4.18 TaxID=3373081 RepID=UPI003EE58FF2